jgi:uncharacterized protein (DUF427 family)
VSIAVHSSTALKKRRRTRRNAEGADAFAESPFLASGEATMTLTFGSAPLGPRPAGRFNFDREDLGVVLYWEPFPKRLRVEFGGATVADSRRAKALYETGHMMRLYVPREDVAMDRLRATDRRTRCPHKGEARYWSVRAEDGRAAEDAVWSYEAPIPAAAPIAGHLSFDLARMDAWYQEDERGYAHPRDPYHRFDIHAASRRVHAHANGVTLAASDRPRILFETGVAPRYYLPPDDVRADLLQRSETVSDCPYKGRARHWHVVIGGRRIEDAAWSLPEPLGEAREIANYVCFYPGKVATEVDGERLGA